MTSELQKRLAALRKVAPRLNSVADEANQIVKTVEKALIEMGIGITACSACFEEEREQLVDDDDGEITEQETRKYLAFGRCQGGYSIHVSSTVFQGPRGCRSEDLDYVDEILTPWTSCDRETRLEAFKELPSLLDQLNKTAEEAIATAERTAATARDMVADDGVVDSPECEPLDEAPLVLSCNGLGRSGEARVARILSVGGARADAGIPVPWFTFQVVDPGSENWSEYLFLTDDQAKDLARRILATNLD